MKSIYLIAILNCPLVLAQSEFDHSVRVKIKIMTSEQGTNSACKKASDFVKGAAKRECYNEGYNSFKIIKIVEKKISGEDLIGPTMAYSCKVKISFKCIQY